VEGQTDVLPAHDAGSHDPPEPPAHDVERTGGKVVEISSSHAVMLSHPQEVAAFIETAARASK